MRERAVRKIWPSEGGQSRQLDDLRDQSLDDWTSWKAYMEYWTIRRRTVMIGSYDHIGLDYWTNSWKACCCIVGMLICRHVLCNPSYNVENWYIQAVAVWRIEPFGRRQSVWLNYKLYYKLEGIHAVLYHQKNNSLDDWTIWQKTVWTIEPLVGMYAVA
jgi:hypothetical protein